MQAEETGKLQLISADAESATEIVLTFSDTLSQTPTPDEIRLQPETPIQSIRPNGRKLVLATAPLSVKENYTVRVADLGTKPVRPLGILDTFYSDKPLGCRFENARTVFRVFAPRATRVQVELFSKPDAAHGQLIDMHQDRDGVWEAGVPGKRTGSYYAYRVHGPDPSGPGEMFDPSRLLADPYSRMVSTSNTYLHEGKTLIFEDDFDWQGDTFVRRDWRDLIILEAHLRDLTAHPSANVPDSLRGSYAGLLYPDTPGGLNYLLDLGVNAVEFLPLQDFGNIELPYKDASAPEFNTWNPYERNHWGYMTSYFFAPETYYARGASLASGERCGDTPQAAHEFKTMVRALHQKGIAVIMDVVYNHVAQYDQNCFKYIDKKYYFRLDPELGFEGKSGCGNDFKTERPMARRLIVDSVLYWMQEYHIDGFRFDLAALLDWETIDLIRSEAQKVNPDVILIAEAWGGGKYELANFSKHGWAAWNDQIRNGIKGQNPVNGHGFIFGKWQGNNSLKSIANYLAGTLVDGGGLFQQSAHAVNYLESHDDHTLGDFIRIGLGELEENAVVTDPEAHARLSPQALRLSRFAALCLFAAQGPVMIAQGQDWGRSKVIAPTDVPGARVGHIDHNSYEKDDATNWLDWRQRSLNASLVNYYLGLIALRKAHPALRRSAKADLKFMPVERPFALGYRISKKSSGDRHDFVVLLNGNSQASVVFQVPAGDWEVVVDAVRAGTKGLIRANSGMNIVVPPTSGMVLREIRH